MSDRDYYEILGLTPGADGVMVDQTYWHLARKYQALAADDARAHHMLDELNEAYGVLGTPRLREQYDAFRDDVLVQRGVVGAVRAKPRPERPPVRLDAAVPASRRYLPGWLAGHWRETLIAVGLTAMTGGAIGLGLSPVWAIAATGAIAAMALTPTARARLQAHVSLPRASAPQRAPAHSSGVRVKAATAPRRNAPSADDLAASTASMIARWRSTVGLAGTEAQAAGDKKPDTTLVEIFQSEHNIEEQDEPLAAVLEVLRGSRRPIETR